jgi:hypothetical protein
MNSTKPSLHCAFSCARSTLAAAARGGARARSLSIPESLLRQATSLTQQPAFWHVRKG